jgi:hypothetical protein
MHASIVSAVSMAGTGRNVVVRSFELACRADINIILADSYHALPSIESEGNIWTDRPRPLAVFLVYTATYRWTQ